MLLNYSNLLLNILIIIFSNNHNYQFYSMKGGLNKIFRNVAATTGKNEFDKVITSY